MTSLDVLLDSQLSLRSRLGYVALLLAAAMMTTVVASLWITEPSLPARTQIAFAVMTAIGVSWVLFAIWILRHRRPLFAPHRIVAGRMAVTFTSLFVIGAIAVRGPASYLAAVVGALMLMVAIAILLRAHREFARLAARRAELARELGVRA